MMDMITFIDYNPNCSTTQITRGTNVNPDIMKYNITKMKTKDLINVTQNKNRRLFTLTQKGYEALEIYQKLIILLTNPELKSEKPESKEQKPLD